MLRSLLRLSAGLMAMSLVACDDAPRFTQAEPGEARAGGATTVNKHGQNAFSLPSANLSPTRRLDFSVGNSFFRSPWVIAPSTVRNRQGRNWPWSGARMAAANSTSRCSWVGAGSSRRGTETRLSKASRACIGHLQKKCAVILAGMNREAIKR